MCIVNSLIQEMKNSYLIGSHIFFINLFNNIYYRVTE